MAQFATTSFYPIDIQFDFPKHLAIQHYFTNPYPIRSHADASRIAQSLEHLQLLLACNDFRFDSDRSSLLARSVANLRTVYPATRAASHDSASTLQSSTSLG
jgi:hypothetical protein